MLFIHYQPNELIHTGRRAAHPYPNFIKGGCRLPTTTGEGG